MGEVWWARLGFAVKGGTWGLAGGAVSGAGLGRGWPGWSATRFLFGLAGMRTATWASWRPVNAPRLLSFSDPVNWPREEVRAGLLAGTAAFLLITARGAPAHLFFRFETWPCAGGAIGFPLGAAPQAWARREGVLPRFVLWKAMEFTFGALLGPVSESPPGCRGRRPPRSIWPRWKRQSLSPPS